MRMAKIEFDVSQYTKKLDNLQKSMDSISKSALYDAAGIVVDAIKTESNALTALQENLRGTADNSIDGATDAQRRGLLDGVGISHMEDDGRAINVKIGFDGCNATKTKKYKNGQPNAVIARSIESGTTFRKKNRFVARAVKRSKPQAEASIKAAFDAAIKQKMEEG